LSVLISPIGLASSPGIETRFPERGCGLKKTGQVTCSSALSDLSDKKRPLRLRKRADFLAVQAGEKRRGRYFLLELRQRSPHEAGQAPRIGFTVSRKNGNAVRRNRIKRRLREAVRVGVMDDFVPGYDYVIVARPDILTLPFDRLIAEIRQRVTRQQKKEGQV